MKKSGMKATTLRMMMIVAVLAIISLASVSFYYAQSQLRNFAIEANSKAAPITATTDSTHGKVTSIIAPNQNYQTVITHDLNKYASDNSISISNISFTSAPGGSTSLTSISGLQLIEATVTINSPVAFTDFIHFLKEIENNIPKLQVTNLDLNSSTDSDDIIIVKPLTLELYTK